MARRRNFGGLFVHLLLVVAVLGLSPVYGQYILNTETSKVHLPTCRTVQAGNTVGKSIVQGGTNFVPVATIEGYSPCLVCNPIGTRPASAAVPAVQQATPAPVPAPGTSSWQPGQDTPAIPVPIERVVPQPPAEKPPLQWGWAKVKRVVDGDTFVLENGKTVRLTGVDTPETVKPNTPVQPFGPEATDYTKAFMTLGRNWVFLELDGDTDDKYDRQLAMVWIKIPPHANPDDCTFYLLNDMLIQEGLATAEPQYNYSQKMKDKFLQSEREAKNRKAGIWSTAL